MIEHVDPFIGTSSTDLPEPQGLAATWWWPKPQVGTPPGGDVPVRHGLGLCVLGRLPDRLRPVPAEHRGRADGAFRQAARLGFTHFQQSGTGAIRDYYNYFRVSPMLEPLDSLGNSWDLTDERAEPGYYTCTLSSGIRCELTVGPRSAVHRYTFPAHRDARLVIDLSMAGLAIPYGSTVPLRSHLEAVGPGVAQAETVVEGVPLSAYVECDASEWQQGLWYDRRLVHGETRLHFDQIRPTTLRTLGLVWYGATDQGQVIELKFGFSMRGVEQARTNLQIDCAPRSRSDGGAFRSDREPQIEGLSLPVSASAAFDRRRQQTAIAWREHLATIKIETIQRHGARFSPRRSTTR